ncbi:MAG TPA: thioredoxin family protein [Chthoniobacter sp.]|jgi:thioredoxin-related protein
MKTLLSAVLLSALLPLTCVAAPPSGWTDNYAQAVEKAKGNGKYLLLDFTGSDWCGFCKLLDKEVFTTPQFKDWAKKNVELVEVDFPHSTPLSAEVKAQNKTLAGKYPVHGFPTIVIIEPDGKVRAQKVGYHPGSGAASYLQALEDEMKKSGPMPTATGDSGSTAPADPNAPKEPSIFKTARPGFPN